MSSSTPAQIIYETINELRLLAAAGLAFTKTHHDRERYDRIRQVAARLAGLVESSPVDAFLHHFQGDLFDQRVSPLSTVDAVVVRGEAILLIKRHDNGLWALPGGLVEVNQTLAEAVLRELLEETGLKGKIVRLLGVFDSRLWASREKVHLHHTLFQVEADDQSPERTREATEVGFFEAQSLPPLSPGHDTRVPFVFKLLKGETAVPYFD